MRLVALDRLACVTPVVVFSPLQADLVLQQGSGYFYVNASVGGIADVTFQESQGIAQVTATGFLRGLEKFGI